MAEEKILSQRVDGVVVTVPAEGMSFYIYKEKGMFPDVYYTRITHLKPAEPFWKSIVSAVREAIKRKPEVVKEVI